MLQRLMQISTVRALNPDFAIDAQAALADQARMVAAGPGRIERPLVVLAGYRSPRIPAARLATKLTRLVGYAARDVLVVWYTGAGDMPTAVAKVIESVAAWRPGALGEGENPGAEQVDVVAISMGGLIARAAAAGPSVLAGCGRIDEGRGAIRHVGDRRLSIARLMTLSSPHRGALLADMTAIDPAAEAMVAGSGFLRALDVALERARYELVCYSRIRDGWVGATRAAPPGRSVLWRAGLVWGSHFTVSEDPGIVADVARRLRGEEPLAKAGGPPPRD